MRLHRRVTSALILLLLAVALGLWALASPVAAHTEPDLVAVPAGSPAVVTLRPTHGCGDSPTIAVSTRVPVTGATARDATGWTATATSDGEGNSVIEWSGGSLPADEVGAFPVAFTAPDSVGELLTFPFVQECANGEELAWIDGDPNADFPAPRLLVLPPGTPPAETLADVPADAPGRHRLAAVIDVDDPGGDTTTSTGGPGSTTIMDTAPADGPQADDDSGPPWAAIALGTTVIGAAAWLVGRQLQR